MTVALPPELYWTILTVLLTSVLWIPHILQRVIELGPYEAFRDPRHEIETKAAWAQRAIRAHTNAVENVVVFGLLVVAAHILDAGTKLTAMAAATYFFVRVGHYVFYVVGVPWLRTPMFLVGFGCQLVFGLTLLGALCQ